jgi:hypothetical protein
MQRRASNNLMVLAHLIHCVPLLYSYLLRPRANLCSNELLQVTDCVVLIALHSNLLAEPIIADDLYHTVSNTPCFYLARGSVIELTLKSDADPILFTFVREVKLWQMKQCGSCKWAARRVL